MTLSTSYPIGLPPLQKPGSVVILKSLSSAEIVAVSTLPLLGQVLPRQLRWPIAFT